MSARDTLNRMLWDNYTVAEKNEALDAYATEVETESWKRALDHVTRALELTPLDLRAPLPAVTEKLEEQLVKLLDKVTELEQRSGKLAKLEAAGVDNWEGYGHALRDDDEDEDGGQW